MTRTILDDSKAQAAPAVRKSVSGGPRILRQMWKGVTLLAAAAAIALSGTAPASANEDSDNLAKIIVGGLIVGAIVNDMQHRDGDRPRYADDDYYQTRDRHRRRIPGDCAITIEGRDRGLVTAYGGRCLRDYGFRNLPDCGRSVRIYGHRDTLYSAQCLRRAGFRGEGSRRYGRD